MEKHFQYWGSWQQLMSGKVIADWIDRNSEPMDPIFGVLLHPTTGRAGPGDSCIFHHFLYDHGGKYAYHSAVHDAFGYLLDQHNVGPGYNYLNLEPLKTTNKLAGQLSGVYFFKKALKKMNSTTELALMGANIMNATLRSHGEIVI